MPDRQMEFFVVSYTSKTGMADRMNVGVVVVERQGDRVSFAEARFVQNMNRLSTFDPDADVELLHSIFRDIGHRLDDPGDRDAVLDTMQDTFSNMLQVSDAKAVLASGDPAAEVEKIASLYLSSR